MRFGASWEWERELADEIKIKRVRKREDEEGKLLVRLCVKLCEYCCLVYRHACIDELRDK